MAHSLCPLFTSSNSLIQVKGFLRSHLTKLNISVMLKVENVFNAILFIHSRITVIWEQIRNPGENYLFWFPDCFSSLRFPYFTSALFISGLLVFVSINNWIILHDLQYLIFLACQNLPVLFCFHLFPTLFSLANFLLFANMHVHFA